MTQAQVQQWQTGISPEALSTALFAGALIELRGLDPLARLANRVRAILQDCFETEDPESAEAAMAPTAFRAAVTRARKAVERDAEAQGLWGETQTALGYAPDEVLSDRLRLRVVPSRNSACGHRTSPLPPHRDSWGAGISAQINWWMPLYPLSETRSMVVWPEVFRRPIANTSSQWDIRALKRDEDGSYPLLPVASHPPATPGRAILIAPGALLAFSAAHLHASRVDDSGRSRFGLDTRSIWLRDVEAGRGAPDVDNAAREQHWAWFARLSDGRSGAQVVDALRRAPRPAALAEMPAEGDES